MKKNGFTLTEVIVTLLLSGILLLVLTCQFIALSRFSAALKDRVEAAREARIVTRHMARVLRFAKVNPNPAFASDRLTVTVEGGHFIGEFPIDTVCYYELDNSLTPASFDFNNGTSKISLSQAVTSFTASYNSVTEEIMLQLQFTKNNATVPIQTTIKVLGQ